MYYIWNCLLGLEAEEYTTKPVLFLSLCGFKNSKTKTKIKSKQIKNWKNTVYLTIFKPTRFYSITLSLSVRHALFHTSSLDTMNKLGGKKTKTFYILSKWIFQAALLYLLWRKMQKIQCRFENKMTFYFSKINRQNTRMQSCHFICKTISFELQQHLPVNLL